MSFNLIAEFKDKNIKKSPLTTVMELKGPSGYDKFCHINSELITAPHIDLFQNVNTSGGIILSGNTRNCGIRLLDIGKELDSIKQYFLENKSRDELQYLIYDTENQASPNSFVPLIPGLIYSISGKPLGYLHSYVANRDGTLELEIPYTDNIYDYEIVGTSNYRISGNTFTFYDVSNNLDITLIHGSEYAGFSIYKNECREETNITENLKVKIVNEYADYLIASQKASDINGLLNKFSEMVLYNNKYYCKAFMSLRLFTFSEYVNNIGTKLYKVPAALVPTGLSRKFMTDVIGLSTNNITI